MAAAGAPTASVATPAPPYRAALHVTGPAWKSRLLQGAEVQLSQPEVHIGILSNNDIVLTDPKASRLHAAIRWTPAGYVIQDLESQNGTLVEGQRITQPVLLVPGQRIQIGDTELIFQPAGVSAPSPVQSRLQHWLQLQLRKRYWVFFLVGLAGYIAGAIVLNASQNNHLVPLVALVGAAVVPAAFAVFCWEEGAFVDMPPFIVGIVFVSGGVFGFLGACVLESPLSNNTSILFTVIVVGLVEESCKAAVAVWFLRNRQFRSELDGLVLGVAAGMGFAAFETAGYGVDSFATHAAVGIINTLVQFGQVNTDTVNRALAVGSGAGYQNMEISLNYRMLIAFFGHGLWTGSLCAAIWRERGQSVFRLTPGVVGTFVAVVSLHAMFDGFQFAGAGALSLLTIPFTVALFVFFLHEAVTRAKLGAAAPPPPPLASAMMRFFSRPFNRGGPYQPHPALASAMASAIPVPATMPATAPSVAAVAAAAPREDDQAVRFCPRCGTPTTQQSRFCANCGSPIGAH